MRRHIKNFGRGLMVWGALILTYIIAIAVGYAAIHHPKVAGVLVVLACIYIAGLIYNEA